MKLALLFVCVGLAAAQLQIPPKFDMVYVTQEYDTRFAKDGTSGFITTYVDSSIDILRSDVYVDGSLYTTYLEKANGLCTAKFVQVSEGKQQCTQVNLDMTTCTQSFDSLEGKSYKQVGKKTLPWGEAATLYMASVANQTVYLAISDLSQYPVAIGNTDADTGKTKWLAVLGFHAPGVATANYFNPPSNCNPIVEPEHKVAVTNKVMKTLPFATPGPPKASCRHKPGTRPCCLFSPDRFRVSHTFAGFEGRECQPNFFDPYCGYACVDVFDCSESKISYCTTG